MAEAFARGIDFGSFRRCDRQATVWHNGIQTAGYPNVLNQSAFVEELDGDAAVLLLCLDGMKVEHFTKRPGVSGGRSDGSG
jgi:hypothetical protein